MTTVLVVPFRASATPPKPDNDNDAARMMPAKKLLRQAKAEVERAERLIIEAGDACNISVDFNSPSPT